MFNIPDTIRHTGRQNQNRHRGIKDLLVRSFGQMDRGYFCPVGRRPRWCFSGGSRCERQWKDFVLYE